MPNPPKLAGSRLIRAKLTEPVRLFVYPPAALVIATVVVLAFAAGVPMLALVALAAGILLAFGVEAARASVWSARGVIAETRKLARLGDLERATGL